LTGLAVIENKIFFHRNLKIAEIDGTDSVIMEEGFQHLKVRLDLGLFCRFSGFQLYCTDFVKQAGAFLRFSMKCINPKRVSEGYVTCFAVFRIMTGILKIG
jgi:hypothetical protein